MNTMIWVAAAILVILVVIWLMRSPGAGSTGGGNKIMVYGSMGCPWTVKQIEYLKEKSKSYEFIDCSSGSCPDFVGGFPTLKIGDKIQVGYNEI